MLLKIRALPFWLTPILQVAAFFTPVKPKNLMKTCAVLSVCIVRECTSVHTKTNAYASIMGSENEAGAQHE